MDDGMAVRAERFKERIGYQELLARLDPQQGVVAEWPDLARLVDLPDDWEEVYDGVVFETGGAKRDWSYRRGEEELNVDLYVSSTGPEPALRRLVDIATNTMMMDIPYQPRSGLVGDLALTLGDGVPGWIAWVFANLCVRVETTNSDLDVFELAQAIQAFADRHVVPEVALHLPRVLGVAVVPTKPRVGERVTVRVVPAPDSDFSRFEAEFDIEGTSLSATAQDGLIFAFEAVAPGPTTLTVGVVDRETLLTDGRTSTIEVKDDDSSGGRSTSDR